MGSHKLTLLIGQGSKMIVLICLVRTKHVGHLRDARRIVVAMSRARLGLCVFGRMSTFKSAVLARQ